MVWKDAGVRRAFMDEIARGLRLTPGPEGWGRVTSSVVVRAGGAGLLKRYGGSMVALLQDVYPEWSSEQLAEKRKRPQGYWKDAANRRRFMDRVKERLGVREAADWRRLSVETMRLLGGSSLLWHYNNSLTALLRDVYPEEVLDERCTRKCVSRSYWDSEEKQMQFLEHVAGEFGIVREEDWRRVTRKALVAMGGAGLLSRHESVASALQCIGERARESGRGGALAVCGTAEASIARWRPTVPRDHWQCADNVRAFLEGAATQLDVKEVEDWGRVSTQQLKAIPGGAGLLRFHSLPKALAMAFPGLVLKRPQGQGVRAAQRNLRQRVADLFHCADGEVRSSSTGVCIKL